MTLEALWLPILLSAVLVFVASAIIHMALPWHRDEYPAVPDEPRARAALGPLAIPPGDYMTPCPSSAAEMKSPEFKAKLEQGPRLMMIVLPNGPVSMGKNLLQWFIYCLVVGLFAAYVASATLPRGTPYMQVFRIASVTAFIGYSLALWQMSIWYGRSWTTTFKLTIDGLLYALLSAGVLASLWPK